MYIPAARALRAGRQLAEAPGPALCRPRGHPYQASRRAGRQPASTALDKPRSDGSPRAGGRSQARDVKKLAPYITRLDAAPGGRSARAPCSAGGPAAGRSARTL